MYTNWEIKRFIKKTNIINIKMKKRARATDKTTRTIVVALLVLSVIISISGTWIILEETYSQQPHVVVRQPDKTMGNAHATFSVVGERTDTETAKLEVVVK